ncbi:MAG: hypothetical protein HYY36_04180, partial [Gammaproteobacteria bacterium]|nr:hypothetical protein [Gammaproteobacteria bacterium]
MGGSRRLRTAPHTTTVLMVALVLGYAAAAAAPALPRITSVPGGIARVPLNEAERPLVYYGGQRVMVLGEAGNWDALVGIPLAAAPGRHELRVNAAHGQDRIFFQVHEHAYASQQLTLADQRRVHPTSRDLERIEQESALMQAAKAAWSDSDEVPLG